jgi:hypothetical protein
VHFFLPDYDCFDIPNAGLRRGKMRFSSDAGKRVAIATRRLAAGNDKAQCRSACCD